MLQNEPQAVTFVRPLFMLTDPWEQIIQAVSFHILEIHNSTNFVSASYDFYGLKALISSACLFSFCDETNISCWADILKSGHFFDLLGRIFVFSGPVNILLVGLKFNLTI